MLAIGRALMSRPRLLLLDEPSLGLAPLIVRQIFEAIGRIARERGRHDLPGRAERLPGAAARRPRLRAGQRPRPAERHRPRAAGQPRGPRRLSRGRPRMSPLDTFMFDWFGDTLAHRAAVQPRPDRRPARSRPAMPWPSPGGRGGRSYSTPRLLSALLRFLDYALADGELWSIGGFLLGWAVQLAVAGLRLPADARAPDGAAVSLALRAQRLAGLGGAALIYAPMLHIRGDRAETRETCMKRTYGALGRSRRSP